MQVKIINGNLNIGGKDRYCPFSPTGSDGLRRCGDWCAFFRVKEEEYENYMFDEPIITYSLSLCKKSYTEIEI